MHSPRQPQIGLGGDLRVDRHRGVGEDDGIALAAGVRADETGQPDAEPGFLARLAQGALIGGLARFEEPGGQVPPA